MSRLFKTLISLAAALVTIVSSRAQGPQCPELLVRMRQPSAEAAAKACIGLGVLVSRDERSGMYVLRLRKGLDERAALRSLRGHAGVGSVLPGSSRGVDRSSYASVEAYLKYLDEVRARGLPGRDHPLGRFERRQESGDFYEALRWYLRGRVNLNGVVDAQALRDALIHKSEMPIGHIGNGQSNANIVTGTWSNLGPLNLPVPYQQYYGTPPLSGRISCIAYDPTTSAIIYAGTGGGGLWKSTDSGATWKCISDVSPWIYPAVSSIAIDPKNHSVLYVGTGDFDGFFAGYNQGIMKSTDGGTTWTNLASNFSGISNVAVSKIAIDPTNDQIVTIATGRGSYFGPNTGKGGVFRSTNGGANWSSVGLTLSDYSALDISVPKNGVTTYWAGGAGTPGLLYKSTDQGATWHPVTPPDTNGELVWGLACSKVDGSTVYLFAPTSNKVFKTTTAGSSWTDVTHNLPSGSLYNFSQDSYDYFLGTVKEPQASSGEVLFCGLITLAYSVNGGATWVDYGLSYADTGAIMHNDQHQFAASPSDPNEVLVGNDGGLFKLDFASWALGAPTISLTSLNAKFPITQFYAVAPHPTDATKLLGGAQDNANPSVLGDMNHWLNPGAGDGGWCAWDLPKGYFFTSSDGGGVNQYDLQGNLVGYPSSNGFSDAAFIPPVFVSNDGAMLFVLGDVLHYYPITAQNPTWNQSSQKITAGQGWAAATCPSDNKRIYTGATDGQIWMTTDEGLAGWKELDRPPLPKAVVGTICAAAANANDILVGFQNTGIRHLFRCANTSVADPVWTDVGGSGVTGLPDVPLNGIVRDPYQGDEVWYVGTDIGVFITKNAGQTWANLSLGLPVVQVFDLRAGPGYLYAGTFGRGAWRAALTQPALVSSVTFSSNPVTGGTSDTGTVTLSNPPGAESISVKLSSSNANAAIVPSSVTVPASAVSANFAVTTKTVSAATATTITATYVASSKSAILTVEPGIVLTSFTLSGSSVVGGLNLVGQVRISAPAPTGGCVVSLKSSSASATVPPSVTIPAGYEALNFQVGTSQVTSATGVTLTATTGASSLTANFNILPPAVAKFNLSSPTRVCGGFVTGTVVLYVPAPSSGLTVSLSSSNPSVVPLPSSVLFKAGTDTYSLYIFTKAVSVNTAVTLKAAGPGGSASTVLTVMPANLYSITASPSTVVGGTPVTATAQLDGLAPAGGAVIALKSNSADASVPSSITVASGASSAKFTVTTKAVAGTTTVVISGTYRGISKTLTLTLNP